MVTVTQCRDSMKNVLLKYMVTIFLSMLGAVYYLGTELATIKAQNSFNAGRLKRYEENTKESFEKFNKRLNAIASNSNRIIKRCFDGRFVYKEGKDSKRSVQ